MDYRPRSDGWSKRKKTLLKKDQGGHSRPVGVKAWLDWETSWRVDMYAANLGVPKYEALLRALQDPFSFGRFCAELMVAPPKPPEDRKGNP